MQSGNTITQCPDNGFIITGYTSMIVYGQSDLTVTKIDADGNIVWLKMLGGLGQEMGKSVCRTTNSEYIILGSKGIEGYAVADLWLILLSKESSSDVNYQYISPISFLLSNNFPNPFNPGTKIKYSIPHLSRIEIKVFDVLGNEIETLVNEEKPAGNYELNWNAAALPSGVYFYQLKADSFIETKKMILLK